VWIYERDGLIEEGLKLKGVMLLHNDLRSGLLCAVELACRTLRSASEGMLGHKHFKQEVYCEVMLRSDLDKAYNTDLAWRKLGGAR
jgi:hypothetical protein